MANIKHLLLGGGIVLGAAACGFLVWWSVAPLPPDGTGAADSSAALQPVAGSGERGVAPGAPPEPPPPPPDLEEMLRQADTIAAATARAESATRMDDTLAEARRRAEEDPKAAMAWALQQGDMVRSALSTVLDVWARTDPAAAFEALRWMKDERDPNLHLYGLSLLVEHWTAADPAAAWKGVGTLPLSPGAALLKSQVARLWAAQDPAAAAAQLKALTSGGRSRDDQALLQPIFAAVAGQLAAQNGPKAAEWALGFAEGSPERTSAVAGVVSGWYAKDAKAVSDWLNRMEDGAVHDAGAAALVELCVQSAPEVALEWAQAMSDEARRSVLTLQVAARWLAADPEKAEAWLGKTTVLSPEQRETILANDKLFRNVSGAEQNR